MGAEGRWELSASSAQFCCEAKLFKNQFQGCLGGSVSKHLPSAQVMIPRSWDGASHWAPCSVESLLLLPLALPTPLSLK